MANTYLSPDVYIQNDDTPSVDTQVAVGVGALVGIAQRGPINEAVRVTSWNQYINKFAYGMDTPFLAYSYLAYSVYGFFQNGGSELYIVRSAHNTAAEAKNVAIEGLTLQLIAKDAGTWGNDLKAAISVNEDNSSNFDLTIRYKNAVVEIIRNLSNSVTDDNYWKERVNNASNYVYTNTAGTLAVQSEISFAGGVDGVSDITDEDYLDSLQALNDYDDEIFKLAIPGQTTNAIYRGVIDYCLEHEGIVPIITPPVSATTNDVKAMRKMYESQTGAIVWPWIYVTDPLSKNLSPNNVKLVPVEGHYMGVDSRTATKYGVHKASAGVEAIVHGAVKLGTKITNVDTDVLNPAGVVTIKTVKNYGICVWGARSLNSQDAHFRYVSDLTLDSYIKRNCYRIGLPYVFRGNVPSTWDDLQAEVEAFMDGMMNRGSFASMVRESAYFVKCDADLNQEHADNNDGIIECEVGYAGSKPAEFIVFRIKHSINK